MNIDTIAGEGTYAKGRIKQSLGAATGDTLLQQEGIADELSGNIRRAFGAARDFARSRPLLTTFIAGVIGASLFARASRRQRA